LGAQELLIVAIVAVIVLFAGPRLPKLGRSMGQGIRGFKQGLKEDPPADDEDKPDKGAEAKPATPDKNGGHDESDPPTS
jgi:sec-independent protein translocase protein TatA